MTRFCAVLKIAKNSFIYRRIVHRIKCSVIKEYIQC
uniref:Uncharacterized protein n=1 Tax=Rhizophora mucronata TaxID=61149 RepID=A0A2P2PGK9_RHIMU